MIALKSDEIWSSDQRLLRTSDSSGWLGFVVTGVSAARGVSDALGVSISIASSSWAGVALGVETSARALDFRFGGIVATAGCLLQDFNRIKGELWLAIHEMIISTNIDVLRPTL
jgi:hypothetical protein